MHLHDALDQLQSLQSHIQRSERFCCYRSTTVAIGGAAAFVGALLQRQFIHNPSQSLAAYLQLWIGVAALSVMTIAVEMLWRWRDDSPFRRSQTRIAMSQFAPCLAAGILITTAIYTQAPEHAVLLPGLWSICFSLGVFASLRQLPPRIVYVGIHYLASGALCLAFFRDEWALNPWSMALTFGVGQLLTAWGLHERSNDSA